MKYFISMVILFFSISSLSAKNSPDDFDVSSYTLRLEFFPADEYLTGAVTVQASSTVENLQHVVLDLMSNLQVDSVSGAAAQFVHENNQLILELDQPRNTDEIFELTIYYQGQPAKDGTFSPVVFSHKRGKLEVETIGIESCPDYARYWWPCKDTPADKPDSVHIYATVPENLDVAANGVFLGATSNENGTRTHHWHIKNPIPTYLIILQIADYAQFSDVYVSPAGDTMPLQYFVFPEDSATARSHFLLGRTMLEILTEYFGEYPFLNEKYGMAEYIGEWAAMEYQTLSCFTRSYITNDLTIFHELTHQWFGDCVSPANFHHTWISEGFATLSEALYKEYYEGRAAYHQYMSNQNDAMNFHVPVYRDDISKPGLVYHSVVYSKGAWVLHTLRHILGDESFFAALKIYLQRFAYSSAVTEDLQQVFEEVSGQDLSVFFQQWIYDTWHPEYVFGWNSEPIANGQFRLTGFIDQKQTEGPPVFEMPLDITIEFAGHDTTFVQMVDEQGEKLDFVFDQEPVKLILDKDDWVLKSAMRTQAPNVVYQTHAVHDSSGNNNSRPDPGETILLTVTIENIGVPLSNAEGQLHTDDPSLTIIREHSHYGHLPHRSGVTNLDAPFQVEVNPKAAGHYGSFVLTVTGENGYSTEIPFSLKVGKANMLFVNNDGGNAYEKFVEPALESAQIYAETWNYAALGSPTEHLADYETVIWLTGDRRDSTLLPAEQDEIKKFLASGGDLLLSGQNIGFDLIENGTTEDSLFFSEVLHASYEGDSSGGIAVMTSAGATVAAGTQLFFWVGDAGAQNQFSTDIIHALEPAAPFLMYLPGGKTAGIYHEDKASDSRLIYLPFGIEGIAGPLPNSGALFLEKAVSWLQNADTGLELEMFEPVPEFFDLSQNYPNPFNPRTTIEFQVPHTSHVLLEVYNLLGQRVKTLVDEKKSAGYFKIEWTSETNSGAPVASGMYLIRFKAGDFQQIKKMMVVR